MGESNDDCFIYNFSIFSKGEKCALPAGHGIFLVIAEIGFIGLGMGKNPKTLPAINRTKLLEINIIYQEVPPKQVGTNQVNRL